MNDNTGNVIDICRLNKSISSRHGTRRGLLPRISARAVLMYVPITSH